MLYSSTGSIKFSLHPLIDRDLHHVGCVQYIEKYSEYFLNLERHNEKNGTYGRAY